MHRYLAIIALVVSCGEPNNFAGSRGDGKVSFADKQVEIDVTFPAGSVGDDVLNIDNEMGMTQHHFSLVKAAPSTLAYVQIERNLITNEYVQGHSGDVFTEDFSVVEEGRLDVLIVIDNSATMTDYQARLASRLEPLLSEIGHTNWQLGFVTTDSSCLRDIVTAKDYQSDPVAANKRFVDAITAGTDGSTIERGVEMAIDGLNGVCGSNVQTWLRPESTKAVLIISDEENCSSGSRRCDPPDYTYHGPDDFLAEAPADTKVYGILYDRNTCEDDGYERDPEDYYSLVSTTKGLWGAICQDDYTGILKSISKDVSEIINRDFNLTYEPEPSTLTVKADGQVISSGYQLNKKTLTFDEAIVVNTAVITAEYKHGALPFFEEVSLTKPADGRTIEVSVNDALLKEGDFAYQSDSDRLTFATQPAPRATIKVVYRELGVPLVTQYALPGAIETGSLVVKVAGQQVDSYTYQPDAEIVAFDPEPMDGESVELVYHLPDDAKLRYPLAVPVEDVLHFGLFDRLTEERLQADIVAGGIEIQPAEVQDGRRVVAKIRTPENTKIAVELPNEPRPGTIDILAAPTSDLCTLDIWLDGVKEDYRCREHAESFSSIRYQFIEDFRNRFVIRQPVDPRADWYVYIDGRETKDYKLFEREVVIPYDKLQPESRVRIRVVPPPSLAETINIK